MGFNVSYQSNSQDINDYLNMLIKNINEKSYNFNSNESLTFINDSYKAVLCIRKEFQSIFKVVKQSPENKDCDKLLNLKSSFVKLIKTYHIKNEEEIIKEFTEKIQNYIDLSKHENCKNLFVMIENYHIENIKKGKISRFLVINEFCDFISLRDCMENLYYDFINSRLEIKLENLYIEIVKLSNFLIQIIKILHQNKIRKFNLNINNILLSNNSSIFSNKELSNDLDKYNLNEFFYKFFDIEQADFFRINFKNEKIDLKLSNLNTSEFEDYVNYYLVIFQIIFFIKNLTYKNIFDFNDIFEFYKIDISVMKKELFNLINEDYKLIVLKYTFKNISKIEDFTNESSIFENIQIIHEIYLNLIAKKTLKLSELKITLNLNMIIDFLFSILEINEEKYIDYFFENLNLIKEKYEDILINHIKNEIKLLSVLVNKYITFIQNGYSTNRSVDLMCIMDKLITIEYVHKWKIIGIFPLVLSYLINCDVDYYSLLNILKHFSYNNTPTIVNLLEKVNLISPLSNYLENLTLNGNKEKVGKIKENLIYILPLLNFENLKNIYKIFNLDEIFKIIKYYPFSSRKKDTVKSILELSGSFLEKQENISDLDFYHFLSMIFSLILYKKNIRSSFLYSTCLRRSIMKELCEESFSEFGFICTSCSIEICIICVHRCHVGHEISPKGYSKFECLCGEETNSSEDSGLGSNSLVNIIQYELNEQLSKKSKSACNAYKSLELPSHVKNCNLNEAQLNSMKYPTEEEFNFLFKSPKPNVFISTETETITIQSECILCNVTPNINDIIIDTYKEETVGYFEVEILMGGYYDQIAIGVTNISNYTINEFAGYSNDSVGYHGDDGKCYVHGCQYTYGTKYGSKDVIGCGVTKSGNIYFVHNSCILPLLDVRLKGNIYPLISLRGRYASVKVIHDPLQFKFKHKKFFLYKNPTMHLSYSHSVSKLLASDEILLKNIQIIARRIKNCNSSTNFSQELQQNLDNGNNLDLNGNFIMTSSPSITQNSNQYTTEIIKKFKKYALIMHKVCKHNRKGMLKYLILSDENNLFNQNLTSSNAQIPIGNKIIASSSKYYQSEENFSKNQNIIEKVLMRPIFSPGAIRELPKPDEEPLKNGIKPSSKENQNGANNSNLIISSVQQSQSSFLRKQNTTRCNNACGNKCNIF